MISFGTNARKRFCTSLLILALLGGGTAPVWAEAQQQNVQVTLNVRNTTIKDILNKIEAQTSYLFVERGKGNLNQKVSVNVRNASLSKVLQHVLVKHGYTYKVQGHHIIISPNPTKTKSHSNTSGNKVSVNAPSKKVTGKVTDATTGEPIVGATILIDGTVKGVITDLDGNYAINAPMGSTLIFRYIGYDEIEKEVGERSDINVSLTENNYNLKDVVVVGYGTQKKSDVVASVNSVNASDLALPTRSVQNMLAGQVAGILAVQRTGEPGNDAASFWIRGISSFQGGTNPLVLVDGVPRSMDNIDVDEIENFTVLKDAAATAVYGAEGANGVILITTKRGDVQKTKVTFSAQYSVLSPTRMPKLMNSYDYLSMWNEASWNDAGNPDWDTYQKPYSDDIIEKYRSGEDTDLYPNSIWTDLLSKHTHNQRYTVDFRGGSERFRFFVSGAYYSEDGIFKSNPIEDYNANIGLKRYNVRSNIDMNITNTTKLSVNLSGQYITRNNPGNSSDQIFKHIVLFPTHLVPMMYSDGTAAAIETDADGRYNPYSLLNYSGYSKMWSASIQSQVTLDQRLDFITKGLSIKGSVSFDAYFSSTMKRSMSPDKYYVTGRDEEGKLIKKLVSSGSPLSDVSLSSNSGTKKIYIEAQLNYNRLFNKVHDVQGVLVFNQRETQYQNVSGISLLPYRKQNFVGRGTYSYDNRYVLEASFGATGSENFASGHRWGIFPAAGIAWNAHSEKFWKAKISNVVNKLRLRASYGITGNDDVGTGRFVYRETLTNSGNSYLGLTPGAGGGATTNYGQIYENQFAAPNLTWEKEAKFNVGIDLGLFRGKIDITADYFSNRRDNILIERVTIPTATGFRNNPYQNFGITTNKGIDASIIVKQNIGKVKLTARGNFTYAKNKIVEKDEIPQKYAWLTQTGRSIGVNKIYIAEGLFTPDDFIITSNGKGGYNYKLKDGIATYTDAVKPGDIKYRDLDGDGAITDMDMTYENGTHPYNPQIVYGFGINLDYKGFFAGVFFQGQARSSVNLKSNTSYFVPFTLGLDQSSAREEAFDHWTAADPNNQNVLYPRLHTTKFDNNVLESTWWYRNGSFLRLKNVEFGYNFDQRITRKLGMSQLRVYAQGMNLAVWDHIKYWDPAVSTTGATYPICGSWTVGLNVAF